MASSASFWKRLEKLEQAINLHRNRLIVIEVDGREKSEEVETTCSVALEALLQELDRRDGDLVVCINRFSPKEGLPKLVSVQPL